MSVPAPSALIWRSRLRLLAAALLLGMATLGQAQTPDSGTPTWSQLSATEQQALQPLQAQWSSMDNSRRQKWREVALRYPKMTTEQQTRLRSRMAEWAAMSTSERNAARMRFQATKQLPIEERQARWDAYVALPDEQRQQLLSRSEQRVPLAASAPLLPLKRPNGTDALTQVQPKSNIVPAPSNSRLSVHPVAPATVQSGTGASTHPLTQRPTPPRHQQAGLPKIAATPEFVDSQTLLPQRGPQGAAIESRRASE
ncbi:MAG: hypothetical protein RJA44_2222 [Pseudomonadota bacterium]|jgi:hypothetical protein